MKNEENLINKLNKVMQLFNKGLTEIYQVYF